MGFATPCRPLPVMHIPGKSLYGESFVVILLFLPSSLLVYIHPPSADVVLLLLKNKCLGIDASKLTIAHQHSSTYFPFLKENFGVSTVLNKQDKHRYPLSFLLIFHQTLCLNLKDGQIVKCHTILVSSVFSFCLIPTNSYLKK